MADLRDIQAALEWYLRRDREGVGRKQLRYWERELGRRIKAHFDG
jgi:hypothetical protein